MIVAIFDTETTGLVKNSLVPLKNQPRIIELFMHLVDDETGETLEEIEFFCNPGVPLEPVITRITGIKPEDLEKAERFGQYASRVCVMVSKADAVVAHNLSFDMALLEADCRRCLSWLTWPQRLICTVEETEWMKGHRLSLTALHEELFEETFKGAHRARHDVEALTRCYLELRKRGDL